MILSDTASPLPDRAGPIREEDCVAQLKYAVNEVCVFQLRASRKTVAQNQTG